MFCLYSNTCGYNFGKGSCKLEAVHACWTKPRSYNNNGLGAHCSKTNTTDNHFRQKRSIMFNGVLNMPPCSGSTFYTPTHHNSLMIIKKHSRLFFPCHRLTPQKILLGPLLFASF